MRQSKLSAQILSKCYDIFLESYWPTDFDLVWLEVQICSLNNDKINS